MWTTKHDIARTFVLKERLHFMFATTLCIMQMDEAFYTSKKEKKFFYVNQRLVYGMQAIGRGASAATRFCAIMNMSPPPAPNASSRQNKVLMEAAKKVAGESMEASCCKRDTPSERCKY